MLGQAGNRRVIEMVEPLRIGHQSHQCLVEIGEITDPWRHRALEVERTALASGDGGTPPGQRIAQEAAAAHLARTRPRLSAS